MSWGRRCTDILSPARQTCSGGWTGVSGNCSNSRLVINGGAMTLSKCPITAQRAPGRPVPAATSTARVDFDPEAGPTPGGPGTPPPSDRYPAEVVFRLNWPSAGHV
ncbi:hypothetical protein ACIPLC_24810 [Kitasatospora sp. NPDC086801]|uniref:hypothetical protein n=1 Tax=Kitasatospora sp. NPDC086801 TaxID=3364066 RepID=UPI003814B008